MDFWARLSFLHAVIYSDFYPSTTTSLQIDSHDIPNSRSARVILAVSKFIKAAGGARIRLQFNRDLVLFFFFFIMFSFLCK